MRAGTRLLRKLLHRRLGSTLAGGKVYSSPAEAVADVPAGAKLLVGGFGLSGVPENLISAIRDLGVDRLTVVSSNVGTGERGLGLLFQTGQISRVISAYVGENDVFERQFLNGQIEVELVPMGTLAERMRCAGAGIPAFYTRTGAGTLVQHGGMPQRYSADGARTVVQASPPRESRRFALPGGDHAEFVMEEALSGDFALIKAWRGDPEGNLVYRKTARNHNPPVATAGKVTIAEVEELVPAGSLDPDLVHTPGIYVHRVVQAPRMGLIERLTLAADPAAGPAAAKGPADVLRERIVRRAALEFRDGDYVNLGIGLPTLVSNFVPASVHITLQAENGMLGVGPFPRSGSEDCDLINAGKQTVTALPGASFFGADTSFAMIRGGHCDVTVLGSMQVAANGDMANYLIPGKLVKGMGGAMDLVASGSRVVVTMEHTDRNGSPKILQECSLPLTGQRVVSRIITEKAVFDVRDGGRGLVLIELAQGETIESIRTATGANFDVSDGLGLMRQS